MYCVLCIVYCVCCIILFYLQQQQSAGSLTRQRLGWLGIRITITSNTQYKPRQWLHCHHPPYLAPQQYFPDFWYCSLLCSSHMKRKQEWWSVGGFISDSRQWMIRVAAVPATVLNLGTILVKRNGSDGSPIFINISVGGSLFSPDIFYPMIQFTGPTYQL